MGRPHRRRRGGFRLWVSRLGAFLGVLSALLFAAIISGVLYAGVRVRKVAQAMPDSTALSRETAGGITQIYSTDKVLLGEIYTRFQERVDIDQIPQILRDATISIEDQRFYEHPGIDLRGIARALYKNASGARRGEGASTLTQQLVRNVILRNREKTVERKLQEALLAYQVERSMTKNQILERYLNEVNYGGQIYGVKMATKLYFGKELKDLTVSEAALIAGLVQSPPKTYPFRHRDAALDRRNVVLGKMLELKKITPAQYDKARAEDIKILPNEPKVVSEEYKAPHFVNYVLRQLKRRHGNEIVFQGGLKIYTTLNWQMQQRADEILRAGIRGERGREVTEGAMICLEPHTGWIRAMAGSVDEKSEVNFTTFGNGRQPGSSFKPIVYAAAFETGKYGPNTEMIDKPLKLGRKVWPRNYGGSGGHGASISIEDAVATSKNTIPAQLIQRLGWKTVVNLAKRMGIKSKFPQNDLSICLGTSPATPLEMASVFSTFANGGDHAEPMAIRLVIDGRGNVLERNEPQIAKSVLRESTAAGVGRCLEAVVDRGTGKGAHTVPGARGKTGTTTDNRDTWFVGYTKELVTAIWASNLQLKPVLDAKGKPVLSENGKPKLKSVYKQMDSDATGGHVCAPIWGRFMAAAVPIQQSAGLEPIPLPEDLQKLRGATPQPPPTPQADRLNEDGEVVIAICEETSKRATPYCPDVVEKSFPKGIKINSCSLHKPPTDSELTAESPIDTRSTPTPTPAAPGAAPVTTPAPTPTPEPPRRRRETPPPTPEPRSRVEEEKRREEPKPETPAPEIEISVCTESSKQATSYCPERVTKRFPKGTRIRMCTIHKPRPGEEDR
jgi:penicillin-binding protein 1A